MTWLSLQRHPQIGLSVLENIKYTCIVAYTCNAPTQEAQSGQSYEPRNSGSASASYKKTRLEKQQQKFDTQISMMVSIFSPIIPEAETGQSLRLQNKTLVFVFKRVSTMKTLRTFTINI